MPFVPWGPVIGNIAPPLPAVDGGTGQTALPLTIANGGTAATAALSSAAGGGYAQLGSVAGWTMPPTHAQASQIHPAAGVLFLYRIEIPSAATVTNWNQFVTVAGNTLANVFACLVDLSGNIVAQTANRSGDATLVGTGLWTAPFSTPFAAPAGSYWGGILIGSATTMPTFTSGTSRAAGYANLGVTGANLRVGAFGSALSALPASPIAVGSITANQNATWAAVT